MSSDSLEGELITLPDGRRLAYTEYGDPTGMPVIAFHGMPGSRLEMKCFEHAASAAGARLIAPDRPGYGRSQPDTSGTLSSFVDDVAQLAGSLGIDRFAVLGVSGGGPYSLACAHRLAQRVTVMGLVSAIGPLSLPGSTRGMLINNRIMFQLGRLSPPLVGWLLPKLMRSSLGSMEKHVQAGTSPVPELSPEIFAILAADQSEAIRAGGQGFVFDMRVLWRPWGFRFEDIHTRAYLWHGEADNLAPPRLAHYMAERLPDCQATFYPGEGHTGPLTMHASEIMEKLVG